jgi:hypothetical protein
MQVIQETYLNAASPQERQQLLHQVWAHIRVKRDKLITATDWTQIPDAALSDTKKAEFAVYRQALRDLPQSTDNPDEIVWPIKPE